MTSCFTITGTATQLQSAELSSEQLVTQSIEKIYSALAESNIFSMLLVERALAHAAESDSRRCAGQAIGPLDGVPVAIKDNLHIENLPTRAGTAYDFSSRFTQSASVVRQLERAGAVIVGTCSMDEAALGATTNNPHTGQCINPVFPGCTPGGSSGGSAAAVAAELVTASLGTDTMGSVRIPAAYCQLWGYKPSKDLVDSDGLVPLCPELDTIGPLTHNIEDLQLMLSAITGRPEFALNDDARIKEPVVAIADTRLLSICEADVAAAYTQLIEQLVQSSVKVVELELEDWNPGQLRRDGLLVTEAHASAELAHELTTHQDCFSDNFQKLMDYGKSATQQRVETSRRRMLAIKQSMIDLFDKVDLLLLPTAPQLAFPVGSLVPDNQADFTALANVTGCPSIAFPIEIPGSQRLASAQLVSRPGSDAALISTARYLFSNV